MLDEDLAPIVRRFADDPAFSRLVELYQEYLDDQLKELKWDQAEEFKTIKIKQEMMEEFLGCFMQLGNADAHKLEEEKVQLDD